MLPRWFKRGALAWFAGLALAGAAHAGARAAPSLQEATDANNRLVADLQAADAAGTPALTMADPEAAALILKAFDVDVLAQFREDDLQAGAALCEASANALTAYLDFGSKQAGIDPEQPGASAGQLEQLESRNSLLYQDEVIPALHFGLRCAAKEVQAMTGILEKSKVDSLSDEQRRFLRQARGGIAQAYVGSLTVLLEPYKPTFKGLLLSDLVEFRDLFAGGMAEAERALVLQTVDQVLNSPASDPAARPMLEMIKRAMKTAPCSALCKV